MKKSILLFLWAAFVVSATVTAVTLGTHANQSDHAMTASVHAMAHAPPLNLLAWRTSQATGPDLTPDALHEHPFYFVKAPAGQIPSGIFRVIYAARYTQNHIPASAQFSRRI